MFFEGEIKKLDKDKKIKIFVDMDGVLAYYDIGKPFNFNKKRPLYSNIEVLRNVSKLDNVEMHILSVCITDNQIKEKNEWLDKYADFFDKDNRTIISRESSLNVPTKELKANYLSNLNKDNDIMVLVDDDNGVLLYINKKVKDIILFQDSVLID